MVKIWHPGLNGHGIAKLRSLVMRQEAAGVLQQSMGRQMMKLDSD